MILYEIYEEALVYILGATRAGTERGALFVEYGAYILCAFTLYGLIKFLCGIFRSIGGGFR